MKIIHVEELINVGSFSQTATWAHIDQDLRQAIQTVHWPHDSDSFTLNPLPKGNGVRPIKEAWRLYLLAAGWIKELSLRVGATPAQTAVKARDLGPVDVAYQLADQIYFCAEWETGNISSSHRAINKICLGMLRKVLVGGVLIIPSSGMYPYLTDRIGNYGELEPYFPLWRSVAHNITDGLVAIYVIEQDALDPAVPLITKGTDGRALR